MAIVGEGLRDTNANVDPHPTEAQRVMFFGGIGMAALLWVAHEYGPLVVQVVVQQVSKAVQ